MSAIYKHDRVVVFAAWHSFKGMRGRVTRVAPLYVLLDGDSLPMRIEERAVARDTESTTSLTGAE